MVETHMVLHILEILGVFVCAHHFWPKGITYGEAEEWEKKYRKSSSRSKSSKSRSRSSSDGMKRRERDDRDDRYRDYDERPRYSRHASARY